MDKEIIKSMLSNSTWENPEKNIVYKFSGGNILSINGKNHSTYSINAKNDKIELSINAANNFIIEFVDDFTLKLSNKNESFIISPE